MIVIILGKLDTEQIIYSHAAENSYDTLSLTVNTKGRLIW
jgi:hypothetical protein